MTRNRKEDRISINTIDYLQSSCCVKKENRNSSHAARAVYQHLVSTQQSFRLLHLMLFSLKQIENLMVAFAAVAYPLLFFSFKLLESYKRNKEITGSSYIITLSCLLKLDV